MSYIFISDFDNTLTNSKGILENNTIEDIKKLEDNRLCILTHSSYDEIEAIISYNKLDCDYFSISSQMGKINNKIINNTLDFNIINELLHIYKCSIYTAYGSTMDKTYIIDYHTRLELIYPKKPRVISSIFEENIFSVTFAINHPFEKRFYESLNERNLEYITMASDNKRDLILVTSKFYGKDSIIELLKKEYPNYTTVGIGDSITDFEFIKHCDLQLAMKNSDNDLKELCQSITELDCDNNGCLNELLKLKNSRHFKKV